LLAAILRAFSKLFFFLRFLFIKESVQLCELYCIVNGHQKINMKDH